MSDPMASFPLSDWRVLDLSSDIAGPYCAKLMTDLGADVIKVETPAEPDPLRRWTASDHRLEPDEDGALFQFLNTSKRSIALDPFKEADRESILKLAERSDIVIESWGPGGLEARGLGARPASQCRCRKDTGATCANAWEYGNRCTVPSRS